MATGPGQKAAAKAPTGDAPQSASSLDEARQDLADAVIVGLAKPAKAIPSRFLYDARGSQLFEEITQLDEYYPTRTEIALLERYGADMAATVPDATALIEFGSGSSRKTALLLQALTNVTRYVPIDIEETCLEQAKERLEEAFPNLDILPLVADFTQAGTVPQAVASDVKLGFFSGSTIGNLTHAEARQFLVQAAKLLGPGASFLVGVDLKKPLSVLLPAYNDGQGVTAAFNLNLLARINRELDADFDLDGFRHEAVYNAGEGRIEMHLVSLAAQTVQIDGQAISFAEGERIHTENSHKYAPHEFRRLVAGTGWRHAAMWTDDNTLFSLHLLRAVD